MFKNGLSVIVTLCLLTFFKRCLELYFGNAERQRKIVVLFTFFVVVVTMLVPLYICYSIPPFHLYEGGNYNLKRMATNC